MHSSSSTSSQKGSSHHQAECFLSSSILMEGNNNSRESSPFSWWWDSHNRRPQSQWLHSTLSELDDKIKTILDLIEDNGETFAKRAEMYYQKKPQLIQMVQDLHSSYRALADKYDQLRPESSIKTPNNESTSSPLRKMQPLEDSAERKPRNDEQTPNLFRSQSHVEESSTADYESGTSSFDLITHAGSKVWDEQMKFSKLLEENLARQTELIKRNDEKREVINELRNENKNLSRKASHSSSSQKGALKGSKSHKRKFKGLFCMA